MIPPGVRFQVSLPTPVNCLAMVVPKEDVPAVEPAYESALMAEVDAIVSAVRAEELAIQWDTPGSRRFEMGGENVSYNDGETRFKGYLVDGSEEGGVALGILIFHGGAGLDEHARFQAERYAGFGYVALAADLYGEGARVSRETVIETITKLRGDREVLTKRANAALATLRADPRMEGRVAVVGFCFGGLAALDYARSGAPLAAAVSIHGSLARPARPAGAWSRRPSSSATAPPTRRAR